MESTNSSRRARSLSVRGRGAVFRRLVSMPISSGVYIFASNGSSAQLVVRQRQGLV